MPSATPPILEARNVHKTYRLKRSPVSVLRGASLVVDKGEWVAVLGQSGSGKSTLLHLLGALDKTDKQKHDPDAGIYFNDKPLRRMSAAELNRYRNRSIGFAFQFFHLLPELSVLENVAIASMIRDGRFGYLSTRAQVEAAGKQLLETFALGHRLEHRPSELSGGERQRVAIAKAVAAAPRVLLMDEPLSSLDTDLRRILRTEIKSLQQRLGVTTLFVTHDADEAACLADHTVRLAAAAAAV